MLPALLVVGRNFQPIKPFLSVYLVEEKKFTTKEIANKIIPWWLYAMLLFSIVVPVIVKKIGLFGTILASACSDIVSGVLLLLMNDRSVPMTVLTELLNAFRSSVIIGDKRYFGEKSQAKTVEYSTLRKTTGIVSSFISQNLYQITGTSQASLYLTILSQICVLILTLIVPGKEEESVSEPIVLSRFSFELLAKIFSYTGAFTLCSCIRIYIDLILIERTGEIGENEGIVGAVVDKISYMFYIGSLCIVKCMMLITDKITTKKTIDQNKAPHGYLEGVTKLVAVCLAIPLVNLVKDDYIKTEVLGVCSWGMQLAGINALTGSTTIFGGYTSYLFSFLGASTTMYISYNRINTLSLDMIIPIMSYMGGISCAVHAVIDVVSRRRKLTPTQRFSLYARIGGVLFASSALCSSVEYFRMWKNS
ncbi:hypothetical protein NEDG_01209 [Nematocida displodere]|uniref:Uncharacterized protein n=1 Tax=Nematocida displodere TaxID=1805483 RepID=A0A177ECF3_9MICR|nr:hypothetical protein NEDG_01209 [Nematocida displodere]